VMGRAMLTGGAWHAHDDFLVNRGCAGS